MGVVSQEPILFKGSFRSNIKYNNKKLNDKDVIEAARLTNALSIVTKQ